MPPIAPVSPLPVRAGPRPQTTRTTPHTQLDSHADQAVAAQLRGLAQTLPDVENRATTVSVPGSRDLWLAEHVLLVRPELAAGPGGRGFAHIHPDASLHAVMDPARAEEAIQAGWAEPHPVAAQLGLTGRVMLYSPRGPAEVHVVFGLVLDAYEHWTGRRPPTPTTSA